MIPRWDNASFHLQGGGGNVNSASGTRGGGLEIVWRRPEMTTAPEVCVGALLRLVLPRRPRWLLRVLLGQVVPLGRCSRPCSPSPSVLVLWDSVFWVPETPTFESENEVCTLESPFAPSGPLASE